jgi:hypothetical protein
MVQIDLEIPAPDMRRYIDYYSDYFSNCKGNYGKDQDMIDNGLTLILPFIFSVNFLLKN